MSRKIVITGAGSGMGAAIAQILKSNGDQVFGIDLKNSDFSTDLSTPEGRQKGVDTSIAWANGQLDGLVLCAGLGSSVNPPSLIAKVNYFGATAFIDGLFDVLSKTKNSSAVVISSVAAAQPDMMNLPILEDYAKHDEAKVCQLLDAQNIGHLAYASSKNALTRFVRSKSIIWGRAGVRINAVAPGAIQTPLLQAGMDDPRYGEAIRKFVPPLGRVGEVDEVAKLVKFLLSSDASYISGAMLFVDGGMDAMIRPNSF